MGYYQAGGFYQGGGLFDDFLSGLQTPQEKAKANQLQGMVRDAWSPGRGPEPGHSTPPSDRVYRRMNVGNVRALRRSMRRVQAFAKLAHKTISFTHHVKMKKHRRR
jgi:hypothetical protein